MMFNNIYKDKKTNTEYLILNPLGRESIEHLTEQDKLDILTNKYNIEIVFQVNYHI